MGILVIDVGGTRIKAAVMKKNGRRMSAHHWIYTSYPCSPTSLINNIKELVSPFRRYDRISVGFPGVVKRGTIVTAPHFVQKKWRGVSLEKKLKSKLRKPVRVINDADMLGLGLMKGRGLELVVTLGTGIGTALFREGILMPRMEFSHHPLNRDQTYNQYCGDRARRRIGNVKWRQRVKFMISTLEQLLNVDRIILTGGNVQLLNLKSTSKIRISKATEGLRGGSLLWN